MTTTNIITTTALATEPKKTKLRSEVSHALWYDSALHRLAQEFAHDGLEPLMIKGRGIDEVYPKGSLRFASDLDLLVGANPTRDSEAVIKVLQRLGYHERNKEGQRVRGRFVGERQFQAEGLPLVEVHTFLHRIVSYPVDYVGIEKRAKTFLPGLKIPSPEDQLLLLVLNAAVTQIRDIHKLANDIMYLTSACDIELCRERARAWGMSRFFDSFLVPGFVGQLATSPVGHGRYLLGLVRQGPSVGKGCLEVAAYMWERYTKAHR